MHACMLSAESLRNPEARNEAVVVESAYTESGCASHYVRVCAVLGMGQHDCLYHIKP
jgi:hypothetical protein